MSRILSLSMLGVLLLSGIPAFSQYGRYGGYHDDRYGGYEDDRYGGYRNDRYGGYRDDGWYGQNRDDRWNRRNRGGGYYGGSVISRVQNDLGRIQSYMRADNHERDHVSRAMSELARFEDQYRNNGRFDKGRLDRAIDNLNHLTNADQLSPRDRDILRTDRDMLRDFRANGGYSNGQYGNYGYGNYRPW